MLDIIVKHSQLNIVSSHNEWDPLEEVIVGSVKGAMQVCFEPALNAYYPDKSARRKESVPFSVQEIEEAEDQLNHLEKILTNIGIKVRRPSPINFASSISTPHFTALNGNCAACPRDTIMVVGNKIIEATMAIRARFFEYLSYRELIKEYFLKGAEWFVAPKPSMRDELYIKNFTVTENIFDADHNPSLTNNEPCFDAASFMRFGKDIFYQPDIVTNDFGAEWLRRLLGKEYRIHRIKFFDKHPPQHLDTTLVPIRDKVILINPERPCNEDSIRLFKDNKWKIIEAPPSIQTVEFHSPEVSNWISMNVLSINEETIVVEEKEEEMIKLLESLDFKVITCPFDKVYKFGGGFHCCTLDVRRKGSLRSYFPTLDL